MEKKNRNILRSFTMVTQIGITMMVPIFLCVVLGQWISRLTGREIWFLVILLFGIGAAFRNVYILTRSFYAADMRQEHERLNYVEELKKYRQEHPEETDQDVFKGKEKRYPDPKGPTRS